MHDSAILLLTPRWGKKNMICQSAHLHVQMLGLLAYGL